MPASRAVALPDRLNSRSKIGKRARAGRGYIDHHIVGLARGHEHFALHTGNTGKTIAVFGDQREAGATGRRPGLRSDDRGTCMRKPAFTRRTSTLPVTGAASRDMAANSEDCSVGLVERHAIDR